MKLQSWLDEQRYDLETMLRWVFIIVIVAFFVISCTIMARAESIDVERLATAIWYAEGGAKTTHPYGILAHYKTTTPRQACINTIRHAIKDWDGKSDFISFLGSRYCPVGAKNDPTNLNRNWIKNVRYYYGKT